jgi:hypothetical protein
VRRPGPGELQLDLNWPYDRGLARPGYRAASLRDDDRGELARTDNMLLLDSWTKN